MLAAAFVAAFVVGPAAAGAAPALKLKAAKHRDGPYVNAPGNDPLVVNVDEPKNLYVKAIRPASGSVDVRLFEEVSNDAEFDYQWFKGQNDISHDVQTSGYLFNLKHEKPRRFRVRVIPAVPDPGEGCLYPHIDPEGSMSSYSAFFAINHPDACV